MPSLMYLLFPGRHHLLTQFQHHYLAELLSKPLKEAIDINGNVIGDGDITTTRDYNTYVRQMDEIAVLKFQETAAHIISGRIGEMLAV